MNILDDLYYGKLVGEIQESSPAVRALSQPLAPLYDQIEAALGSAFLKEFEARSYDLEDFNDLALFRRGFRLGAGLMLEALSTERS